MAGLSLVCGPDDWQQYIQTYEVENGMRGSVEWGQGPQRFPCLVASISFPDRRIVSCYVYPEQAHTLLQAAGELPEAEVEETTLMSLDQLNKLIAEKVQQVLGHSIREIAANLRAIVQELVEVKITTPERYEALLTKHLADVDQYVAECKEAAGDQSAVGRITRRILPKDEDVCGE